MMKEEQIYQIKWHNYAGVMPSQHILVALLQKETLDVQKEDGYNNLFSLRTNHYSMIEPAAKENSV
jgi:hypothetical protein